MRPAPTWIGFAVFLLIAALAAATPAAAQTPPNMKPMGTMMPMSGDAPVVPPVTGYSEGETVLFMHTETSDPKIAQILTDMMGGSPVLVVPSLANAPREMLGRVYVFTNGGAGEGPRGPLGGQGDIFDHPPGTPGYSPLRQVVLVTWNDVQSARIMKSAAALQSAIESGAVSAEETNIIVNMPFLTWPGGKR